MSILYTATKRNEQFEAVTGGTYVDKTTLQKEADFISLHVPLFTATRHYISEAEFNLMKDTAILINTSRRPVADEKALVKALAEGRIWGAALDVFENEPAVEPELMAMDNVVIIPHIGSATIETRTNMGLIAAKNIIQALQGECPDNCLNPEVLKKRAKK